MTTTAGTYLHISYIFQHTIILAISSTATPNPTNMVANPAESSSDDSDGVPIFIPIAVVAGVLILVAGVVILLGIVWWQRGNLSMLKP